MATKREFDTGDNSSAKRVKMQNGNGNLDPANNPYLAHMRDNGPSSKSFFAVSRPRMLTWTTEAKANLADGLYDFKRHATTSKQARAAEDGPLNPFTGKTLSSTYMSILKTRRDLPVHQQRYVAHFRPSPCSDGTFA